MVPLISNSDNSTPRSTRPLARPFNFRMPHVFVIPPEEEQQDNPPWCCFDADEQPGDMPSNPDIHFLDVPYLLQESDHDVPTLITRRTSVHRPRPRVPMSKKLEKKQRPEAIKIIENKPSQAGRRDSDVIEVVKVKRARESPTDTRENTNVKRSKTLRARASKALHSIKNVGKSSHRTHVKELWTSSESMPGIFKGMQEQIHPQQDRMERRSPPTTPAKKRSLSRAASRSLSQIFHHTKPLQQEPLFTPRVASPVASAEAHCIPSPAASSLSHPRCNDTNPPLTEVPSIPVIHRPISPNTSMKKKQPTTKFSVRELHRLFSFGASPPDVPASTPTATTSYSSSTPSGSMPSTSTYTASPDYSDAPMDEDIFADAHFIELGSAERKLVSRYYETSCTYRDDYLSTPRRLGDLDFEMRLSSLHFESLSFDPDDFDISMGGDIPR